MPLKDHKEILKYILGIFLLASLNFIGAKSVSIFAYVENDIALLWPPTGISFAFLLRFGLKWWPGIFFGELLFHFLSGQSFLLASTTGLGVIVSILVSIYALRKVGFSNHFSRQKDVLYFVLLALTICPVIDASIGTTARLLDGMVPSHRFSLVWISWVVGDVTALIVLAPVIATFPKKKESRQWSLSKIVEGICLFTGISLVSFFIFFDIIESKSSQIALVYLPMPFLIWSALSFRPFQTALAGLITSGMAVIATAQGNGPFIQVNIVSTIGFLWTYLIVASILALLLAAIHVENLYARRKIQESEARFKALSKASFEAIFITIDGMIIDFNNAATELSGYNPKQLRKMAFIKLLDQGSSMAFQEYVSSKQLYPFESRVIRKDGSNFFAELRYRIYQQEEKQILIFAIRDITQLKDTLDKEQELNEELAIREEELKEQLLFVENMNVKLEKVNKALDRFVYSASHDLRAPISSALGLINIARMEKNQHQVATYLDLQEKSLKRLDHFIGDILDFSRNSRTDLLKEEINFEGLLQEIFNSYEFVENSDKIKKIVEVNQHEPFISDKRRLNIILNNLISNAIRYYNPFAGEPFLKVQVDTNYTQATIQVIDNGLGIGSEHIDKVFDMFYRASSYQVGSGLGLYIVQEVLEKLKGSIYIESELNKGTCFTVTIPNNPS